MSDYCEVVITADNADWLAEYTRRLVEDRLAVRIAARTTPPR